MSGEPDRVSAAPDRVSGEPDRAELRRIFEDARTIAVVGCSASPAKPAHIVPSYLQRFGYRIAPVNPREEVVLGEPALDSLREVGEPVEVVLVFRPAEEAPAIAADAVAIGAGTLWLQEGIVSQEAARVAAAGGLRVVMGTCMGRAHAAVGLGPGP